MGRKPRERQGQQNGAGAPRGSTPPQFQVPRDLPEPFLISSGAWFPQPEVRIGPPAGFALLLPSVHPHHGVQLPAGVRRRRLEAPGGSAGSPLASPTLGTACHPPGLEREQLITG